MKGEMDGLGEVEGLYCMMNNRPTGLAADAAHKIPYHPYYVRVPYLSIGRHGTCK